MKTEITKTIEQAIIDWNPQQIGDITVNQFRQHHTGLEVPVECGTTACGIIDAVRISEYFGDIKYRHICRPSRWRKEARRKVECPEGKDPMGKLDLFCDNPDCRFSGYKKIGTQKILLTCFEIKVTMSDFKSEHGHNLVGNMNYYVVPEELYEAVDPLVPDGIGILVYLHKGTYQGLRSKRKPTYKEMTDGEQKWLILSTFKRIRDMDYESFYGDNLEKILDLMKSV